MSNKYSYLKYYHSDKSIATVEQLLNSDLFFNNSISKQDFLKFRATEKSEIDFTVESEDSEREIMVKKEYETTANIGKDKKNFIKKVGSFARTDMQKSKILASLTIAQAILESGWGESELSKNANNLFGIKGNFLGNTYLIETKEYLNNEWLTIEDNFKNYPSVGLSLQDHSNFLLKNPRYSEVIGETDYKEACRKIQEAGYATAPNYADSLIRVIESYNLTFFDSSQLETKTVEDILLEDKFEYEQSFPSNAELIWSKYSFEEKYNNGGKYSANDLTLLKQGTVLFIPLTSFNKELLPIRGKNFLDQSTDIYPFFSEKQLELESDESYVKATDLLKESRADSVQIIEENCQVWIYSKTLDKIIDVSPFIQTLSTTKGDIGSFSFNLVPISVILDRASNSEDYNLQQVFGTDYINEYNLFKQGKLNISFFDKYFQQNDVVFIRFERLQKEENNVIRSGLEISKQCLPDQIFDMMGLIDVVGSSINAQINDYNVSMNGRDFTKALVEDGQYLMGLIYVQGDKNRFFYGGNPGDKFFKRNYVADGAYEYMFTKRDRKGIPDSLAFIINQMSNIGWTNNELFHAYGDRRTSAYRLSNITDYEDYVNNQEVNGIWQIIKLNVDKQINGRRILNESMFDVDGTLIEFFKNICQEPFVEFWGDTYGSQFEFIVRQPPLDAKGVRDVLNNEHYIDIPTKDTLQVNLNWEDEYYSWFQFLPDGANYDKSEIFYGLHFPLVYLEKYIENFGNHRKVINDKYIPEASYSGKDEKQDKNTTARALFNDLKYALEYYSVLPFTRKGTIVINGDRRIKKGGFVLLEATNELCYVESVSNSVSFNSKTVDRITTLTVKRCMIKDYIKSNLTKINVKSDLSIEEGRRETNVVLGTKEYNDAFIRNKGFEANTEGSINVAFSVISYFDIVKSKVITDDLYNRIEGGSGSPLNEENFVKPDQQTKTDFTVRENAFEFFLKRKQMD